MNVKLKKAIIDWLVENEHEWQRLNACIKAFKEYIFNGKGGYLIGGEDVCDFIKAADKLLFGKEF